MTRKKLAPLTQGDVTGECVIYSAINAVRLLWPEHFGEIEACEKLYGELVSRMEAEGIKAMLVEGTESDVGVKVASLMKLTLQGYGLTLGYLGSASGPCLHRTHVGSYALKLSRELKAECPAVIILGLDDPWDHWTVATKVTPRSVTFFDSYGPDRLKRRSWSDFTLTNEAGKIQIDAPATVIYCRLDTRVVA